MIYGTQRPQHEQRPENLERGIAPCEHLPGRAKSIGDRRGHDQSEEHEYHQEYADRPLFGIEPVRYPAGIDPCPPHAQKQDERFENAPKRQVAEQPVGQLGDGKDENQVEKKFDVGDFRAVFVIAWTK